MIMLNQNMVKMQACCMDPGSFIIHIKRYHIYKDISDFKLFQDTSNYEPERPLPKGKN